MSSHANLLISLAFLFILAGCANTLSNEIHVEEDKPSAIQPKVKHSVSIRVAGYVDKRTAMSPQKIGITNQRVTGVLGTQLLLDQEVATLVGSSLQRHFQQAGYQVVREVNASALYELRGVIHELTYNVLSKDEVAISIESTLTEIASGKVVWSGVVHEKPAPRFPGIYGNSKSDVANYLKRKLAIVAQKTAQSIGATLMASNPELFDLKELAKVTSGITVLQAASAVVPTVVANGKLILNTQPARAKVYLDGVYFGLSPLDAEIEAGVHQIKVFLEGYQSIEEKVSVRKGVNTELELQLNK